MPSCTNRSAGILFVLRYKSFQGSHPARAGSSAKTKTKNRRSDDQSATGNFSSPSPKIELRSVQEVSVANTAVRKTSVADNGPLN